MCPKCKSELIHFFQTDNDYGHYEILECHDCKLVFSPQRQYEKSLIFYHGMYVAFLFVVGYLVLLCLYPSIALLLIPVTIVGVILVGLVCAVFDIPSLESPLQQADFGVESSYEPDERTSGVEVSCSGEAH